MTGFKYTPVQMIPSSATAPGPAAPPAAPTAAVIQPVAPTAAFVQPVAPTGNIAQVAPTAAVIQPVAPSLSPDATPIAQAIRTSPVVQPASNLNGFTLSKTPQVFDMGKPSPKTGDNLIVNFREYSPKSVVVFGPSDFEITKNYKDTLIAAGGKYIGMLYGKNIGIEKERFPGYIFRISQIDNVSDIVDDINSGRIEPKPYIPKAGDDESGGSYRKGGNYQSNTVPEGKQRVSFLVDQPTVNHRMLLRINERVIPYTICNLQMGTNGSYVISFKAKPEKQEGSEVHVTTIGEVWQIYALTTPHTVILEPIKTTGPVMPTAVPQIPGM